MVVLWANAELQPSHGHGNFFCFKWMVSICRFMLKTLNSNEQYSQVFLPTPADFGLFTLDTIFLSLNSLVFSHLIPCLRSWWYFKIDSYAKHLLLHRTHLYFVSTPCFFTLCRNTDSVLKKEIKFSLIFFNNSKFYAEKVSGHWSQRNFCCKCCDLICLIILALKEEKNIRCQ
jgi:hypothetical protein